MNSYAFEQGKRAALKDTENLSADPYRHGSSDSTEWFAGYNAGSVERAASEAAALGCRHFKLDRTVYRDGRPLFTFTPHVGQNGERAFAPHETDDAILQMVAALNAAEAKVAK